MSSSAEEAEVDDAGQGKHFFWHNDHVRKLANYVTSKMSPDDGLLPYNTVDINWDGVEEVVGVDSEKCMRKWKLLLSSVRTYRTMPEIVLDIISQNCRPEVAKYNKAQNTVAKVANHSQQTIGAVTFTKKKKKRKINPAHPKRPKVNGYAVFCGKMASKLQQSGVKGVAWMLKMASMWKNLSESERMKYNLECVKQKEAYLGKVQDYAEKHPDDLEIKEILAEESARVAKSSHQRKGQTKDGKDKGPPVDADDTFDDTVLTIESDSVLESPKKTPKKKRPVLDESQDSTPSKKKKKVRKEKVLTAEEVFIETKIDGYRLEHPDMDDDDIMGRLSRKFNKLSEEKKAKYKRKAEERNS